MKLGYARVSTDDQRLDLQRVRLIEAGCSRLFEEKISGTARQRPALERLLRSCAPMTSWLSPGSTAWHAQPRSCCALPRLSLRKMRDCSHLRNPGRIRRHQLDGWS